MYCPLDKSRPCPFPLKGTEVYLGENEHGYFVMDGFFDGITNMFKRMVKFTPKSFTPGNIFKAVRNTTLTTMTGGVYLALPKSVKKTMENVANVAMPIAAAGIAAVTLGPAVMGVLGPKLTAAGGLLGKGASSIGQTLFGALGKLAPSKQTEIAQQVTPNDIAYAETHGGKYPPHIQVLIDQAEQATYGYAAYNALNPNASLQQPPPASFYADSKLYPGLQAQYAALQQSQGPQSEFSPVAVAGVGAGVLALVLLMKK